MAAKKTTTKKTAKEAKAKSTRKTKAAEAPAEIATTSTGECPRGGEEVAHRLHGEIRVHHQHVGRGGHQRHRREVLRRIVG